MSFKNGGRSLFGSRRPRYFSEPKPAKFSYAVERRRSQRVKFRRRTAGTLARRVGKWAGWLIVLGAAGAGAAIGLRSASAFCRTSPWFRVSGVEFLGDRPAGLETFLALHPGDFLLEIHPRRLEQGALAKFPELKDISIRRAFDRRVSVRTEFRTPIMALDGPSGAVGVDGDGFLFPIRDSNRLASPAPHFAGAAADRFGWLGALSAWKKRSPEFYSLVKSIETDKMHGNIVELDGGVKVFWDGLDEEKLARQADRVLAVLKNFSPSRTPATLRIVGEDRIIMDANWRRKDDASKEGNRVKA